MAYGSRRSTPKVCRALKPWWVGRPRLWTPWWPPVDTSRLFWSIGYYRPNMAQWISRVLIKVYKILREAWHFWSGIRKHWIWVKLGAPMYRVNKLIFNNHQQSILRVDILTHSQVPSMSYHMTLPQSNPEALTEAESPSSGFQGLRLNVPRDRFRKPASTQQDWQLISDCHWDAPQMSLRVASASNFGLAMAGARW